MPSIFPDSPPKKPLLWALVDCNSFYCSCERLFRPDLKNKPVVVLSNNDGCLIALTPEAKALGFKMGDVYHLLEKELKAKGVTAFSSNYTLYGDISRRFIATLESVVPAVEQYSIDEAFVPFDRALTANVREVGWTIHDRVKQWVGVPVRVGIGSTRTLAKLANHWAKKISRVLILEPGAGQLEDILERTPTVDLWGIGRRLSAKLARMGIDNARQLRDMDLSLAKKFLTVVGQKTVLELRGVQCIEDAPVVRQTLINSRSFGRPVSRREDLMEALTMHCTIAAERLRAEGLEAAALAVHMETSRHADFPFYETGASVYLAAPTNVTSEFIKAARTALEKCYRPHKYMKGGIVLFEIADEKKRQRTLLEDLESPKKMKAAMKSVDQINDKFGRDTIRFLSQGSSQAFWHMKRNFLTGHMTTGISRLCLSSVFQSRAVSPHGTGKTGGPADRDVLALAEVFQELPALLITRPENFPENAEVY